MRRKVLLVSILILSMLIQCIAPFMMVYAETEAQSSRAVIALNSNVYKAVKAQLKAQGIIAEYIDANGIIIFPEGEIEKVTTLNLSNSEIDDLDNGSETYLGLDGFTNLEVLNLHANNLTKDSNLDVLDKLPNLNKVDLSSNQIESINSISSFHDGNIEYDITNQNIIGKVVINVDDSEESEDRVATKAMVALPQILLEAEEGFNASWIWNPNVRLTRENVAYSYQDSEGYIVTANAPEIDFENSFQVATGVEENALDYTGDVQGQYPYMLINVAQGTGDSYRALRGLIKFKIEVLDSTSKLANTQITFYYLITGDGETGIAFYDGNLYRAIKEQLTQGQTINQDETIIETTNERNIYKVAYDEAMVLVIDEDDMINKIPSLVVNDRRITDLKGLEEFVGLDTNLNISYNYIKSIDRIIELEQNKAKKEAEIREKYKTYLDKEKAELVEYDKAVSDEKTAATAKQKANEDYQRALAEYNAASESDKPAKQAAMQSAIDARNAAEIAELDAQNRQNVCLSKIDKYQKKLYKIYEKEFKMVSILPSEINYLEDSVIDTSTKEQLVQYATAVMDRISSLEQKGGLTNTEITFMKEFFTQNFEPYTGLTWREFNTITVVDPENPGQTIVRDEPIENPISAYFETLKNATDIISESAYRNLLKFMKALDAISQLDHYSKIKRTFDSGSNTDEYILEALNYINKSYNEMGYDLSYYNRITKDNISDIYSIYGAEGGYRGIYIKLYSTDYAGIVDGSYKILLAQRQSIITDADLETYIRLPRLKYLNIADNKTCSLEGIESLTELVELNAWKNMVNDITNVNWSLFNNLRVLNLGYNQISNITPLESLLSLVSLNVSYNLLEGRFDFRLLNMKNLAVADFSHNQYSDIQYANDQFILRALGYDSNGDGRADGLTVPEWMEATGIVISFQYQSTEMETTIIKDDNEFIELELPLIFRQLEKMDNARTSFGVDSIGGLVEPEGTTVKLRVPGLGNYEAIVSVEGRNGYTNNDIYGNGYTTEGIGYGTTCRIKFNVIEETVTPDPDSPVNPDAPDTPVDPENPDSPVTPAKPEYGYEVGNGFVFVLKPETTATEFINRLVDSEEYNVEITGNNGSNMSTGAIVAVTSKDGQTEYDMLEVVVKGDLNGDGEVDALDSGIIRTVINDTAVLAPGSTFEAAADVNSDGDIDSQDSMMILKYRADRISSFE